MAPGDLPVGSRLDRIEGKLDALLVDVAVLKERDRSRAIFWGGLSGLAVTIIGALLQSLL